MNQLASTEKSKRLSENLLHLVSHGRHTGNVPFGYAIAPYPHSITTIPLIIEGEATVVREVFRLALCGHSISETELILARAGLRGRSGALSRSSIHSILRNPYYAGLVRLKGELFPGIHQGLVSLADFHLAAKNLSERKSLPLSERLGQIQD